MKLSSKRKIDYYIGNLCLFVISPFVRLIGLLLKKSHKVLPIDSILIIKFQGIGSLAISIPAIIQLRSSYPNSKIIFWGTPSTCMLAQQIKLFDMILEIDDRSLFRATLSIFKNFKYIYKIKPDWVMDLEVYSKLSVFLCTLTLGRNRAGFAIDTVRLRQMNHTHLVFFNRHQYLGIAYERLFGLLNIEFKSIRESLKKSLIKQNNRDFIAEFFNRKKYIVINPNAGELALERRWPIEFFQKLIQKITIYESNLKIVLIGSGASEKEYCRKLESHANVFNFVNCLSLTQTINVMDQASLIISNDSAPLHFGLIFTSVPVIGLFGPTYPKTYVPPGRPKTHIHFSQIYCSPCLHYWDPLPCKGWNQCMESISVDQVFKSCADLIEGKNNSELKFIKSQQWQGRNDYYPGLVYTRRQSIFQ